MMLKKLFLLLSLFTLSGYSQNIKLSDQTKISVLTIDKGAELYSVYGHSAIRIHDVLQNLDVVYNYGTFDFSTPYFYLKYTKGDLQYFLTVDKFEDFLNQYTYENRAVFEQEIKLNSQQKQTLFDGLNTDLVSDKRFYTYKFIDRNCTTMVLEKINSILEKNKIQVNTKTNLTFREIFYDYQKNMFFENLGINIILGSKIDELGTKTFLPKELLENLKQNKLIAEEVKTLNLVSVPQENYTWWNSIYFFYGLLLCIAIFSLNKYFAASFLMFSGCIGLFFSIIGLYSYHEEVLKNYNILLFNPVSILLAFSILKNKIVWIRILSWLCFVVLVMYTVMVSNKIQIYLVLPIILGLGSIFARYILKSKKLLPTVK
jgi:Domain of unknown function (DUF4105)